MFSFLKRKLKEIFKKTREELEEREGEKEGEKEKEEVGREEKRREQEKERQKESEREIKEIRTEEREESKEESKEEEEREEKGLLTKLRKKFGKTKIKESYFERFFEELEIGLIENNVAIDVLDYLKEKLRSEIIDKEIKKSEVESVIKKALKKAVASLLLEPFDFVEKIKEKVRKEKPFVIVFFGINGVGKTLTIAKIANLLKKNGLSCVLAASDTFRAAAIEQLEKHAKALEIKMIKHDYRADPAAVAFDAIAHAKAKGIDVVLIDTAGRIHLKTDLMEEMKKIVRVAKPDLKIFVAEAIAGNDAIEQAKAFNEAVGIDASILTKADVDERGGTFISIGFITKKPILFLGTGQGYDDLIPFNKEKLLESIFTEK